MWKTPKFENVRFSYSKKIESEFGFRIFNIFEFEKNRHFEYGFDYSKNEYSNVFVGIRPSLMSRDAKKYIYQCQRINLSKNLNFWLNLIN